MGSILGPRYFGKLLRLFKYSYDGIRVQGYAFRFGLWGFGFWV